MISQKIQLGWTIVVTFVQSKSTHRFTSHPPGILLTQRVWIDKRRRSARVVRKLSECDSYHAMQPSPPCLCIGSSRVYIYAFPPPLGPECQHALNAFIAANVLEWTPEYWQQSETRRYRLRYRRGAQPVRMKGAKSRSQLGLGL